MTNRDTPLTREAFLARCGTAYDKGLIRPDTLRLLERWTDLVLRLEGGQLSKVIDLLEAERQQTRDFHNAETLANDADGYAVVDFVAILVHPCQQCGESVGEWHTRAAMCPHKARG